ncbi:hypothetical protein [Nitrospira moscoviensis]|uniref:Uncharacterized protein n=1 Tax=Nitrospira moscoviensis TaxID=42253 RepID=A0A0K2GHK7_NITMO|nr:hypothetical protein [Nitrospira moscoviensis]ALA60430.1 hypothetical protein NITMOv2_4046 [Nitrospira moscoviensis]
MLVDVDSVTGSALVVLLMGGLITGFSVWVGWLAMRIGCDDSKGHDMPASLRNGSGYSFRKAA